MSIMQEAFNRSRNETVREHMSKIEKINADRRRRSNERHAREMRDKAIAEIHSLSYSRNGKLVPRKKHLREKLEAAKQRAKVYAYMARPANGYPEPPRRLDPEYPIDNKRHTLDLNRLASERNRLAFWLSILEKRGIGDDTRHNILCQIQRLERKLVRMRENDGVRKTPGRHKEYRLNPAPTATVVTVLRRAS